MKLEHRTLKLAALIGFAVLAVVIFAQLFKLAGGRLPFRHPYVANALVPEPFNLVPRSDVRTHGVQIGEVTSLRNRGTLGQVEFSIDKAHAPLYRDATVLVRSKTLVGETYLDVDPGTPRAGTLPSGSVLPVQAAQEAVPLDKILNTLDPATRREVRRNMAGLGKGLNGRGHDLNELFGAIKPTAVDGGRLMSVLRPQRRELAALIDQTGTVLSAFGERSAQVRSVVRDAKATAEAAASRDARLREVLDELPSTLAQAKESVARVGAFSGRATPVVRNLRLASADLAPALRDLAPAAHDARGLFRELQPFLRAVDPVVAGLRPASGALRTTLPQLDAVLRQAAPAVSYLKPFAPDMASMFANVGAESNTRDAVGNVIRVHAVLGPDQFTNMPDGLVRAEKALLAAGALEKYYGGPRRNPYPKPGTAGHPNDERAFGGIYPHLAAAPPGR
jgi:phospholipid/cholesterol/gamma-HCH transport system substrate-binding protein